MESERKIKDILRIDLRDSSYPPLSDNYEPNMNETAAKVKFMF